MQMTGDPSPLPRAPSRGFRDKPRRNYNAFNRHVRHFCNKCLITRPCPLLQRRCNRPNGDPARR